MNDQHAGSRALDGVVIGDKSFERRVALFIFDDLGVDAGANRSGAGQSENS